MKRPYLFLSLGMFSLSISIAIERFGRELLDTNFIVGFFIGLSLVFNIASLVLLRKERQA